MAGTSGSILFADNIDFSGGYPIQGEINLNGELLVGSTVAPNIRPYVPTGSNGLVVNTGNGTIDFTLANIPNTALSHSKITISQGAGLTGGGTASLGGSISLDVAAPVTTAYGGTGLTSAGANGNVLTSNGTNWVSSPSTGIILQTTAITWTNVALKAGTALTLLAAQGSGVVIIPLSVVLKFEYGGTNAFTNAPTINLTLGGTNAETVTPTLVFWEATTNQYFNIYPTSVLNSASAYENGSATLTLSAALTGNAAANNIVKAVFTYYLLTIT